MGLELIWQENKDQIKGDSDIKAIEQELETN